MLADGDGLFDLLGVQRSLDRLHESENEHDQRFHESSLLCESDLGP